MIRGLKALGPALAAVLTLAALSPQVAAAAQFHSEAEPTTLKGANTSTFRVGFTSAELTCSGESLSGSQSAKTAETITLSPFYTSCHIRSMGLNFPTSINLNGCDYTLSAAGTQGIDCPGPAGMEFKNGGCTLKIPAQTLAGVSYSNSGKGIVVTRKLSGLSHSHAGLGCGTGSGTEGTMEVTSVLNGYNSGGTQVKIWRE